MIHFDEYIDRFRDIRMERRDGVLEMTLHSGDGPLRWNDVIHEELPEAFRVVGQDLENRVVILTGQGDAFLLPSGGGSFTLDPSVPPVALDAIYREGMALLVNELAVPVPMIAAVNGPSLAHSELALLCDIVLAASTAVFQDRHLRMGIVPGDGIHIAYPMAFGINRGRYLALSGAQVTAQQAYDWGGVAEIVEPELLRERAWELATYLAARPILGLRYTRQAITLEVQRLVREQLGYGLMLEGFASGYGVWDGSLHQDGAVKPT
jgi:enoyl-CoA hydratase/carnithine racemase